MDIYEAVNDRTNNFGTTKEAVHRMRYVLSRPELMQKLLDGNERWEVRSMASGSKRTLQRWNRAVAWFIWDKIRTWELANHRKELP